MNIKDNPCKRCQKATLETIGDLDYGCSSPCKLADYYFTDLTTKVDTLVRLAELMKEETK